MKKLLFVLRNDFEGKVNGTYFCREDGAFHWKGFLENGFIGDIGTYYFIVILGAIRKYILMVSMV